MLSFIDSTLISVGGKKLNEKVEETSISVENRNQNSNNMTVVAVMELLPCKCTLC